MTGGMDFGIGALVGGLMDMGNTAMQTRVNVREAHKHREWQEAMRASQYQAAVKDMRKAGINPILAARFGGSGVPSGSAARAAGGGMGTAAAMGQAVTSAKGQRSQAKLQDKQRALIDAQLGGVNATTRETNARAQIAEYGAARAAMENWEYEQKLKAATTAKGIGSSALDWLKPAGKEALRQFMIEGMTPAPTTGKGVINFSNNPREAPDYRPPRAPRRRFYEHGPRR